MFDFHEKRKIRSWVYSKTSIFILVLLAGLLSMSVYERYTVEREMKEKMEAQEAELQRLQARALLLEEKVHHLNNERGIEEELRGRFDVAKEGERVVIIVDDEEDAPSAAVGARESNNEKKKSFFEMLKFW